MSDNGQHFVADRSRSAPFGYSRFLCDSRGYAAGDFAWYR